MAAFKNKDNGTWYVQFRYTDWQGNRQQKLKRGFATKREAQEWEREFLLKKQADINMTLESFAQLYEKDVKPKLKLNTWLTKESIIQKKILPYLGKRKLSEITARDVIDWQNEIRALTDSKGKPYSSTYLKTVHNQLSAIFNHAVRYYGLQVNPAARAGNMGTEERREMLFWTQEEYRRFADAMMDKPLSYYASEIPRENYRIAALNCGGEDFAIACMRTNLRYGKNQKREDVKSHHYIISFDPRDGPENGLTMDKAQALGEAFCAEHFPGHQALVCTHADGHNHSGNIHVHIVINSVRIADVPLLPYMNRPADTKAGMKHRCTDAAMEYFKSEVMELCHREGLYQIDLLNGSGSRVTEREYWAARKQQATLSTSYADLLAAQAALHKVEDELKTKTEMRKHLLSYRKGQPLRDELKEKAISTRGLKPDATKFCELVFDVNSAYFYNHGGYDFAKQFYEEAYRAAVEIVGGEQYILSAVMHADERNRAMSEQLGEDVYHYHLHVVYVPVVKKEILWSKRCKDPTLRGAVKDVITQVSRSKKWSSKPAVDDIGEPILQKNGKPVLKKSYSVLQDDFYRHMVAAGYTDIERGEVGSTEEHLTVTQFKVEQEQQRLARIQDAAAYAMAETQRQNEKMEEARRRAREAEARLKTAEMDAKAVEDLAREFSDDVERVLPEAGALESARTYREKKAKPLYKKIVGVLRTLFKRYLDLS